MEKGKGKSCVFTKWLLLWALVLVCGSIGSEAAAFDYEFHGYLEANYILRDTNRFENGFLDNLEGIQQLIEEVITGYKGKTVLIVNHSNLIHPMIKLVKKEDVDLRTAKRIDERIYDDIFIVSFSKRENAKVLSLKYGKQAKL